MCATRTTYENFALKSRYVFPPLLKSKLPRHNARFIRNRNSRYANPFPISGGSNRLEFPTFFSVFQFLSDALLAERERESVLFFEALHKGVHLPRRATVHRRWNKGPQTIPPFDRLSTLVQRGIHTRSIVRAADR